MIFSPLLFSTVAQVEIDSFFDTRQAIDTADEQQVAESRRRHHKVAIAQRGNDVQNECEQPPNVHEDSTLLSRHCLVRPTGTRPDNRIGQQDHQVINRKRRGNRDRNWKFKELPGDEHHLSDHPDNTQPEEVIPDLFVRLVVIAPVPHFDHLPFWMCSKYQTLGVEVWWGEGGYQKINTG